MFLYKLFQNGYQIKITRYGCACAVYHFTGEILTIPQQFAGNAGTLGVGNLITVAINELVVVVDIGLGQHNGLFALGQVKGFGVVGHRTVRRRYGFNKVVKVYKNVAVVIKLL